MSERLLFLTGHLAYPRLERMMRSMGETLVCLGDMRYRGEGGRA